MARSINKSKTLSVHKEEVFLVFVQTCSRFFSIGAFKADLPDVVSLGRQFILFSRVLKGCTVIYNPVPLTLNP